MRIQVKFRKFELEFDAEQIRSIRHEGKWYNVEPDVAMSKQALYEADIIVYESVLGMGNTIHRVNLDRAERVSIKT